MAVKRGELTEAIEVMGAVSLGEGAKIRQGGSVNHKIGREDEFRLRKY
jgi:hypothetical protein